MNILILHDRLPSRLTHGGSLRVFYLSQELASKHRCYLVTSDHNAEYLDLTKKSGIFQDVFLISTNNNVVHRWGIHRLRKSLRLSNENYKKLTNPEMFSSIIGELKRLIKRWQIDVVVAVALQMAEFIEPLHGVKKIVDDYDCNTLKIKRCYKAECKTNSLFKRLKRRRELFRVRLHESKLTEKYDLVTTISPSDLAVLRNINRINRQKIILLPNGVSPQLISYEYNSTEIPNSIIFWGSMDFMPNETAVRYFFEKVFLPFLSDKKIEWYIVGPNPSSNILEIGRRHPLIKVMGYMDDLFGFASRIPIMINPMQVGGGLKNKVLEAFALRRLVISNRMGMEAINAVDGKHYIHAETSRGFAEAILKYLHLKDQRAIIGNNARQLVLDHYTWSKIGDTWRSLVAAMATKSE